MSARAQLVGWAALASVISACGDGRSAISTRMGDLRLELPDTEELSRQVSWDFGEVPVGTSTRLTLGLVNVGQDWTELNVRFEQAPSGAFFALAPDSVAAESRAQLVLTFAPPVAGPYSARVVLQNDGQGGDASVQLAGFAR